MNAAEVKNAIRSAFTLADVNSTLLRPAVTDPARASLAELVAGIVQARDWREPAAQMREASLARLRSAKRAVAEMEREAGHLAAVAEHLCGEGSAALPRGLPPEVALAARILAGSTEGAQAGAAIKAAMKDRRAAIADLRAEVERAASALEVVIAGHIAKWASAVASPAEAAAVEAAAVEARDKHLALVRARAERRRAERSGRVAV